MNEEEWEERAKWARHGIDKGWITDSICITHDDTTKYWNEEDLKDYNEGGDPCLVVLIVR